MKIKIILSIAGFLCATFAVAADPSPTKDKIHENDNTPANKALLIGKQIYLNGLLPSGEPVKAIVQGDVKLPGNLVTCVGCHQRSGMGSAEAGKLVLPITKQALYERKFYGRTMNTVNRLNQPKVRPAYTDSSLKIAIKDGIGSDGKPLDALMPHFQLSDKDLDSLVAYLKTLSVEFSPGVHKDLLKFATIVTEDADPAKASAMIEILQKFIVAKNSGTRSETRRAKFSPWHKEPEYTGYRKWELKIWRLNGPADTWHAQLLRLYQEDPVFAVLSGISTRKWEPIHNFCVEYEIPCLFPNTDLPKITDTDFYPVYLTKGQTLQAEILIKHLLDKKKANTPNTTLLQIYQNDDWGKVPTNILGASQPLQSLYNVKSVELDNKMAMIGKSVNTAIANIKPGIVVFWLNNQNLNQLLTELQVTEDVQTIYLPMSVQGTKYAQIPVGIIEKTRLIYPFEIPNPNFLRRTMVWAKSQKINPEETFVLANAYLAVNTAAESIHQIRTTLYRDYFLERIEHMLDNMLVTSVFPRTSIAPNQRFASKGGYIVKFADKEIVADSEWINP